MNISQKRLSEIEKIRDEDIDFSDIPELDDAWFERAKLVKPNSKKSVSLRLDSDVLDWYRSQSRDYQSRINAILRAYMNKKKAHVKT